MKTIEEVSIMEEMHQFFTQAKMVKKAIIVLAQLSWKGRS